MIGKKDDNVDGLKYKDSMEKLPDAFLGEIGKFRGWSHEVYLWAAAIYAEGGKKLLDDAAKFVTE